jgi:hypothetical protein
VVDLLHLEVDLVDRLPFLEVDPFLLDLDLEPLLHHQSPLEEAFEHLQALARDHGHLLEASLDHPYRHMHHPLVVVDKLLPDMIQDYLLVQYTHLLRYMALGNRGLLEEASFRLPYREEYIQRQQIPDPYRP